MPLKKKTKTNKQNWWYASSRKNFQSILNSIHPFLVLFFYSVNTYIFVGNYWEFTETNSKLCEEKEFGKVLGTFVFLYPFSSLVLFVTESFDLKSFHSLLIKLIRLCIKKYTVGKPDQAIFLLSFKWNNLIVFFNKLFLCKSS